MNVRTMALVRGVTAIGATAALVVGVTFAALTSNTVTLSDNTINTATANLAIWDGSTFTTTATGFHVTGLLPGHWSTPKAFYLKNAGDADLNLTMNVPTAPSATGFTGWDNLHIAISDTNTVTGDVANTTMLALLGGQVPLNGVLAAGAQGNSGADPTLATPGNYFYSVWLDPAAVTGSSASVGSFALNLVGTSTP